MINASASLYLFACTCNRSYVGTTLLLCVTLLSLLVLLAEIGSTEAVPKPPPVCNSAKQLCTHQQDLEIFTCQPHTVPNPVCTGLVAVLK